MLETSSRKKTAIIIGAGPAGLTAAYELLQQSDMKVIIYELEGHCGGLSATLKYNGNGIDIGGHRFYSKSQWVMDWWQKFLPLAKDEGEKGQEKGQENNAPVMLVRRRLSRILFMGKLFQYPLSLSWQTLKKFPLWLLFSMTASYLKSKIITISPEKNLEDFYINRFGKVLYQTFFKSYTEKVWGVPCTQINPEWGPQRIKGLSIYQAIIHAIKKALFRCRSSNSSNKIRQKNTPTSLIESFLYPKRGPGQLWEAVAKQIIKQGGEIHFQHSLRGTYHNNNRIAAVEVLDGEKNQTFEIDCDYLLSSMPMSEMIAAMKSKVPEKVKKVARGLQYRDYIIVGVLLKKSKTEKESRLENMQDNWLYIQEPRVKLGRIQIFNNWSRGLIKDNSTIWLGLEYFCQEADVFWQKSDEEITQFAVTELEEINLAYAKDVIDSTIIRVKKAYPAYLGSYEKIEVIRDYVDKINNLYLIGRNGMHRYNNQDHSMLTAKAAVECIVFDSNDKSAIWQVNAEDDYLEN